MSATPYRTKRFDVKVAVDVAPNGTRSLPRATDEGAMFAIFGNRSYSPYKKTTWSQYEDVDEFERDCVADLIASSDYDAAFNDVDDRIYNNPDWPGLDLGVAGAVFALSAAGCRCGASCNAGAFGGFHPESYPLVAFLAKDGKLDLLRAAAEASGAGLRRSAGTIVLYADRIVKIMDFGTALRKLHSDPV